MQSEPRIQSSGRARRGQHFLQARRDHRLEQEACLELPLGFEGDAAPVGMIAVLLHAFHVDVLVEIWSYLLNIPFSADLFVSTDTEQKRSLILALMADWPRGNLTVEIMENRGRDIAPKIVGFDAVHRRYDYVLHLHTKHSAHDQRLAGWRGYLFETLLGSPRTVRDVFTIFANAPRVGILAPQHIDELRPWIWWGDNYQGAEWLAKRIGMKLRRQSRLDFPSGSMFWARTRSLQPLLDAGLAFGDFPEEEGQTDGTLAHAVERLYFLVCEHAGFDWLKITARGELHDQRDVAAVFSHEELTRFITHATVRLTALSDHDQAVVAPVVSAPPPKPKRVLPPLWRDVLGVSVPTAKAARISIVLEDGSSSFETLESAGHALASLPRGIAGSVVESMAASRNAVLRSAFKDGAEVVLIISQAGLLHPGCAAAIAQMAAAHPEGVLIEGQCVPDPSPKPVDVSSFAVEWVEPPIHAVTSKVFRTTGGFDENIDIRARERDLSERARDLGFAVLRCPVALFFPAVRGELA